MKIYLYIKGETVYCYKNSEKREIVFENLENFIKENRGNYFVLIFSKLNVFFRKVEFDFVDKKKISLILSQEIEGKLPLPIDNFYFYLNFQYPEKNKTIVGIFAIEKDKINYLKEIFKINKAKYIFLIDSLLLDQFFKNKIKENNFIELFAENDYFLINLIENSVISGVYSYSSDNIKEHISEILPSLFSTKKHPVYFIGDRKIYQEIKIEGIHFLSEATFFNILEETKKIKSISFQEILLPRKKINLEYIFYFFLLVICTLFFINPHFEKIEKEKKVEEINKRMENLYKSIFPETKKIINPLIQIKEKMLEDKNYSPAPIYKIPIIKILEEITNLFPENINVEVEEVLINNKNLNLICTVESLKDFDIIEGKVRKSKIFTDFIINDISFTKENKVKFNILLKMVI
ncbi:MAG: hypothetical protein NC827_00975 [Candidatus Omnitrophica bacterium]|nr:hypothetical protein [Candidatus Omnitrophota bacterium]MCM8801875.1 hypothetical protein [Candidatus Omnitrophota bacterium]